MGVKALLFRICFSDSLEGHRDDSVETGRCVVLHVALFDFLQTAFSPGTKKPCTAVLTTAWTLIT